jgi:preprotein translocase subunit SecG
MAEQTNTIDTINTGLGNIADDTYNYINSVLSNPTVLIILIIVVIIYIVIFMSLGDSSVSSSNSSVSDTNYSLFSSSEPVSNSSSKTISMIVIAFLIILVVLNALQYFIGVDIIAKLKYLFTGNPEVDITVNNINTPATVPDLLRRPQVFNIPGNNYVYPDAKALCSAYGARLATYPEVEKAYTSGAEWCNYGWSDGQMALFPTQQKTYDHLQKIEGHENDCGRPGVNGGYIANPAIKFGVNCYGYKPRINSTEEELMANEPIYPKTLKDIAMEQRVEYWKDKLSEIIVSPFNHNTWSKL